MDTDKAPESADAKLPETGPQAPPPLGPSPEVRQVMYRAVALGAVIFIGIAVVLFVIISLGSGLFAGVPAVTAPPGTTVPSTTTPAGATISLPPTTAPVEIMPANLEVSVSVDEKSYSGTVTVNFLGGAGRTMVKEIDARLTLPDGSVVTGTMDPQTASPQMVLQGSKGTDQLEVFARMFSGKVYKIFDQKIIYPSRYQ